MNRQGQFEARTWNEIKERSGLSKGAMSKYLPTLFEEGYIKGEVRVVNHRLVNFYLLAHPEVGTTYEITEKDPTGEDRIYLSKDPKNRKIPQFAQCGVRRRSRKTAKGNEKMVFRRTGPRLALSPLNSKGQEEGN
jgi:DNA-binding Lrp family transcriptional regulator